MAPRSDGDVVLAGAAELGPVPDDRIVIVQLTTVDETVHDGGDDPLGGGEAGGHRVAFPRLPGRVTDAGPGVDDQFTAVVDGHRCAGAGRPFRHQLMELLGDGGEVGVDETFHHPSLTLPCVITTISETPRVRRPGLLRLHSPTRAAERHVGWAPHVIPDGS